MAKVVEDVTSKNTTSTRYCSCISSYQDTRYGTGKRLHNRGKKAWRCTVCGHEKNIG